MKYKMICSDLDDTLVNSKLQITDNVRQAIHRYIDSGGKFFIVTGRMTSGALPVCRDLGLKGEVVTFQGAEVVDIESGKILEQIKFSTDEAVEIAEFIEQLGCYYQTYVDDYFIVQKANEYTELYAKLSFSHYKETQIKLSSFIKENKLQPPKILIMGEAKSLANALQKFQNKFGDKYLANTSKPFLVEIVSAQINKGIAVQKLGEKYGIKRQEIIAIGDSSNDIAMLEYAGLGVAVANSTQVAIDSADIMAPSCDDDAVAWVIDNIALKK